MTKNKIKVYIPCDKCGAAFDTDEVKPGDLCPNCGTKLRLLKPGEKPKR